MHKYERRKAARVAVQIPTLVEVVGQREIELHPNLAAVYERVEPAPELIGEKFPSAVRDLSTNGAFIAGGRMPPLMSRVAFAFPLEGLQIEVLGWVLWRRTADCEIPTDSGDVHLPAGFGVLFEAIPLDARNAISQLVS
jgi:hypothetical protein